MTEVTKLFTILKYICTYHNFRAWCESHLRTTSTHLSEEFTVRDRGNRFLNISHNFYDLLLSLETSYLTKRTFLKVPEDEIVLSVGTNNFHNPNEKCLNLAMYRYVRMRAYLNTKKVFENIWLKSEMAEKPKLFENISNCIPLSTHRLKPLIDFIVVAWLLFLIVQVTNKHDSDSCMLQR